MTTMRIRSLLLTALFSLIASAPMLAASASPVESVWFLPMVLLGVGVLLLILEFGVIPGFGVAGISGFILTSSAIYLGYQEIAPHWFDMTPGSISLITTGAVASVATTSLITFGMVKAMPYMPFTRRMIHSESLHDDDTGLEASLHKGLSGIATTDLRPAGKIELGGRAYDVTTSDGYINAGEAVVIDKVRGNHVVVRRVI